MINISQTEKLAVLLNLMSDDAVDVVLNDADPNASREVRDFLEQFGEHPPTKGEVEFVVDDFVRYFRLAMENLENELEAEAEREAAEPEAPTILQIPEEEFEVEIEPTKKFVTPSMTGNAAFDLNRMHPYQVAHAIQDEPPSTIGLVLRNLATEHAAKTLEFLPDEVRPAVFLNLAQPSTVAPLIVDKILKSTLEKAMKVEEREPVEDNASQMVELIRSLPKKMRAPILQELMEKDEETGKQVKSQMYQFDDLNKLSDKDLQQILMQAQSESLVYALQGAEPELIERIFSNMSKRASEALREELTFKTNAKQEEIEGGRSAIVQVLVKLDEAGSISLD